MVTYTIKLLDPMGNLIYSIDNFLSFTYTRPLNDIGSLTVPLPYSFDVSLLRLDGRLCVYRDGRLDTETVWLIRKVTKRLSSRGEKTIIVEAVSANELLKRRLIAYASDTAYSEKTDQADDMMKQIVRENMGASATETSRSWASYLTVQADTSQGPSLTSSFAWANVMDTLQDISQATITAGSSVYFDVVAPTQSTLEFRTYRDYRGIDHRFPGGTNPVILSTERGNITEITRAYDWTNEVTYVYANGGGFGSERGTATASSAERIGNSVFNRREATANAQTGAGESLQQTANAGLRSGRPVRIFDATLVNVPGTEYGVHWGWGDLITAEYESESIDCSIDAIQISFAKGKETIKGVLRAMED